ncbi:MAG: hypothetical protein K2G56_02295, partial [Eubacterium sp.]|nr:hypothetical protein [Eubacterium sp.]
GKNCTFLLNVPPTDKGVIHHKDVRALKSLGKRIHRLTANPILIDKPGEFTEQDGYIDFAFDSARKLKTVIIKEAISKSQRVESFDIYIKKENGKFIKAASETIIGSCKIIALKGKKCVGARLVVRQSRSNPVISEIGFYE